MPRRVHAPSSLFLPALIAGIAPSCCPTHVPDSNGTGPLHVEVPSSIARLPDPPPSQELQWHCFDNTKIPDDSGCATTRAGCKKIARIRQASYEKFNVPFEASECDIPIKAPWCYYYQDADLRYLRYDCCKTEACCRKSQDATKFEVLSECKESPPIERPKSYKLGD